MRIVNTNASLVPEQDGVTRVLMNLIRGAHDRGHEVLCVGGLVPEALRFPTPMVKVPGLTIPGRSEYKIPLPGYRWFRRQVLEWKPDILHIHSPCPLGFAAAKFAREYGIPVVATYHTHFPTYVRYYAKVKWEDRVWRLLRRLYNQLDATFVPALSVFNEPSISRTR
jgi:phosphatidylinositol alpha 1,6-mannosyltransferase